MGVFLLLFFPPKCTIEVLYLHLYVQLDEINKMAEAVTGSAERILSHSAMLSLDCMGVI